MKLLVCACLILFLFCNYQHLLREMLDKDYRSRIDLNGVITDEWVTQEGSDPLFSEQDMIEEQKKIYAGHVLVIDDSITFRNLISRKLDQANCTYVLAKDADEGIAFARASFASDSAPFGCILVDYLMPRKNGVTAVTEIRGVGYCGKIIGISSFETPDEMALQPSEVRAAFMKAGADDFWEKPIRSIELVKLFEERESSKFNNNPSHEQVTHPEESLSVDDVQHAIATVKSETSLFSSDDVISERESVATPSDVSSVVADTNDSNDTGIYCCLLIVDCCLLIFVDS